MALYPTHVEVDEKRMKALIDAYKLAYEDIVSTLEKQTNFSIANRKQILAQISAEIDRLAALTQEEIELEIPRIYAEGADDAVKQLRNIKAELEVTSGFNLVNKRAIAALVDGASLAFAEALTTAKRDGVRLLGVVAKQELNQALINSKIAGEGTRKAVQRIKGIIAENGINGLYDRSGKRWSLDSYAEMLFRTKMVEARNTGLINRMVENGYDLVQVSSHQGSCSICAPYEGLIYSITGSSKLYPPLSSITNRPGNTGLFHPRCRHALNTIVPSLAREINAYNKDKRTKRLSKREVLEKSKVENNAI